MNFLCFALHEVCYFFWVFITSPSSFVNKGILLPKFVVGFSCNLMEFWMFVCNSTSFKYEKWNICMYVHIYIYIIESTSKVSVLWMRCKIRPLFCSGKLLLALMHGIVLLPFMAIICRVNEQAKGYDLWRWSNHSLESFYKFHAFANCKLIKIQSWVRVLLSIKFRVKIYLVFLYFLFFLPNNSK